MKRLLIILLSVLTVISAVFFVGCGKENIISIIEKKGYTVIVTVDYCGGTANLHESTKYYVKSGSHLPEMGEKDSSKMEEPSRKAYTLDGLFYGTKDETTGEVTYGKEWNAKTDTFTEDTTLYAKWSPAYSFTLHYGEDNSSDEINEPTIYYLAKSASSQNISYPILEGYTFKEFIYNGVNTRENGFNHTKETVNIDIYTSWIENAGSKTWEVVTKATEFTKALAGGKNIYLYNDIDFENKEYSMSYSTDKTSQNVIDGNGKKVSNLIYNITSTRSASYVGLFSELDSTVKNITFDNVTLKITNKSSSISDLHVGFICGNKTENGIIDRVTMTKCKVVCIIDPLECTFDTYEKCSFNLADGTKLDKVTPTVVDGVTYSVEIKTYEQ